MKHLWLGMQVNCINQLKAKSSWRTSCQRGLIIIMYSCFQHFFIAKTLHSGHMSTTQSTDWQPSGSGNSDLWLKLLAFLYERFATIHQLPQLRTTPRVGSEEVTAWFTQSMIKGSYVKDSYFCFINVKTVMKRKYES